MLQSSLVKISVIDCLIKELQRDWFLLNIECRSQVFDPYQLGNFPFAFVITKIHINDFEVSNIKISIRSFDIMFHHM